MMPTNAKITAVLAALVLACGPMGCGSESGGSVDSTTAARGKSAYWDGPPRSFCRPGRMVQLDGKSASGLLVLDRAVSRAGRSLQARIENLGRERLEHGLDPKIDRRVDGHWAPGAGTGDGKFTAYPALALIVEPGFAGHCVDIRISKNWRPGRYRVTFDVRALKKGGGFSDLSLVNYFSVTR